MTDITRFTINVSERPPNLKAQSRRDGNWADVALPLAQANEILQARVSELENRVRTVSRSVIELSAEISSSGRADAQEVLFTRTEKTGNDVLSQAGLIRELTAEVATKATTAALQSVTNSVNANASGISASSAALTALTAEVATKATAAALTALSARVTTNEEGITSESQRITELGASLNDVSHGLDRADRLTVQFQGSDATYLSGRLVAGGNIEAGPRSEIRTFTIQKSGRVGNRFTLELLPSMPALWPAGDLTFRVGNRNLTLRAEGTKAGVNAPNEWHVETGIYISSLTRVQEILEARVNLVENVDGSTTLSQLARWLVKTKVGDLQGGIGLYNDGTKVQLLVQADRFAILPTGTSLDELSVPFIVEDGVVYMDEALIRNGTIVNAMIKNATITTAKLKDLSVSNAKIADLAVNNAKIADATIEFAKMVRANIFDLTIGNKIESDNFIRKGTAITTAVAAKAVLHGITFTHGTAGAVGNGVVVNLTRLQQSGTPVKVASQSDNRIFNITLLEDHNGDVTLDRNDIVTAFNAATNVVVASGTGTFDLDFSDPGTETVMLANGLDTTTSHPGRGFSILRSGEAQFLLADIADLNALKINADQITAGLLTADRIDSNIKNITSLWSGTDTFNTTTTITLDTPITGFDSIGLNYSNDYWTLQNRGGDYVFYIDEFPIDIVTGDLCGFGRGVDLHSIKISSGNSVNITRVSGSAQLTIRGILGYRSP